MDWLIDPVNELLDNDLLIHLSQTTDWLKPTDWLYTLNLYL